MTTTSNILSRLGKNVTANQNHSSGIDGDKKDPNTPLEDFTKQGGIDGNPHRKLDKAGGQEPIDTSKGESGVDDSTDKQDYAKEYEGIYKGKGSVESAAVIGKKLKEGLELSVNLDDMKSLLESVDGADAEFVTEALQIFEATMLESINTQIDSIVVNATDLVESVIEDEVIALEEQVEDYLNVAIMEWAEDNRLAIEESTRTNIAESFMRDLTGLMESYNIVLPEESVDLYEHSIAVGESLLEENEELAAKNAQLNEELQTLNKAIYVESFISDSNLTVTESERLRNVSDELEFINESDFINKLNTISESYIKRSNSLNESKSTSNQNLVEDYMETNENNETEVKGYRDPMVATLAKHFTK